MDSNTIFTEKIKVSDEDASKLVKTIFEVDALKELAQRGETDVSITPMALKLLYGLYMDSLQKHKELWTELLIKYAGAEKASRYSKIYRFDIYQKVIFCLQVEGCSLCQ